MNEKTLAYLKSIKFSFDNIHYHSDLILSKNKPFNFIISAREAGKSTDIWRYAFNCLVKRGKTTIVLRRQIADITEVYIDDVENIINKFADNPVQFFYKMSKDGIINVNIGKPDDKGGAIPFFRIMALSVPMRRFKSLLYPNLGLIIFDEFIVNIRMGEKYLKDEVFRFKELYNTFQREADNLRCIFMGNPYSLYNPYFSWKKFKAKEIFPGAMLTTDDSALEAYELTEELKEYILNKNPLYKFDDAYKAYAFDGRAINDQQVYTMETQPSNFRLQWVFYTQGKYIGIYYGLKIVDGDHIFYWVADLGEYKSGRRSAICFDLNDLISGNVLATNDMKNRFMNFRHCIERRTVAYKTIEEAYLTEEIYQCVC